MWISCVMQCDEYLMTRFLSFTTTFWYRALLMSVLVLPGTYRCQHVQTSTFLCLSFTVFHPLGDSWGFVFTFHFLMSEILPYSPPFRSWNSPSVSRQRVSSDRNPRTWAAIWLPVIPAVPRVCYHHRRCSLSRCWQMARWTHSGRLWRFSEWNHNTGPGPLLMECRVPAVQGWKTAINHRDEEADPLQELVWPKNISLQL